MNYRTVNYFNRKKALSNLPKATDLRTILKTGFFASGNLMVKRDILKIYTELSRAKAS